MNERWVKMEMFLYEMFLIKGYLNGFFVDFCEEINIDIKFLFGY